jgi:DNA-binding response OmpR family regulator
VLIKKSSQEMRILVVEDELALAGFIRKGLEAEHYVG